MALLALMAEATCKRRATRALALGTAATIVPGIAEEAHNTNVWKIPEAARNSWCDAHGLNNEDCELWASGVPVPDVLEHNAYQPIHRYEHRNGEDCGHFWTRGDYGGKNPRLCKEYGVALAKGTKIKDTHLAKEFPSLIYVTTERKDDRARWRADTRAMRHEEALRQLDMITDPMLRDETAKAIDEAENELKKLPNGNWWRKSVQEAARDHFYSNLGSLCSEYNMRRETGTEIDCAEYINTPRNVQKILEIVRNRVRGEL